MQATDAIKLLPFAKEIDPQDIELLARAASVQDHSKHSHIFLRGDPPNYFYMVINGWVKLYRETQEGDEVVLGLLARSESFGETAIFSGETYAFNAQAVEETKILSIASSALKEVVRSDLNILIRIMQSFSQQMSKLQLENEHLSIMSASQRVGCMLLQLMQKPMTGSTEIHLPYDKSLAANRLGMKPETFSRALSHLKDIGITVQGNAVKVGSVDNLVHFVCADCSACGNDCHFSKDRSCNYKKPTN